MKKVDQMGQKGPKNQNLGSHNILPQYSSDFNNFGIKTFVLMSSL